MHHHCRKLHQRSRRRCLLIAALAAVLAAAALLVSREFALRFRSFWLDPQPSLQDTDQGAKIAVAFPLPLSSQQLPVVRRVHFMYKSHTMEDGIKPYLRSWRQVYPDYELFFWTDKEIDKLVASRYPTWVNFYHEQLTSFLERSDVARAFILHSLGGWYSDVDGRCLRSAEPVVRRRGLVLPLEPYLHAMANFNKYQLVSNAIMYSTPGHPFWLFYLQHVRQGLVGKQPRKDTKGAAYLTGPVAITEAAVLYNQAHSGSGCPLGSWCPYLAPPLKFMPTYKNTESMRQSMRFYCAFTFRHREFLDDCQFYKRHDYRNHIDPALSYTYHEFMHINDRSQGEVRNGSSVLGWGLRLLTGSEILASFAQK